MTVPGWKVLLIDDDEEDCMIVHELLSHARQGRYELHWEKNYAEGFQAACSNQYDAMLVDWVIGPDRGTDLIRQATQQNIKSPMILLTGYSGSTLDLEALEAGAADYLEKNQLTAPLLEKVIRYAMERRRMEDDLRRERTRLHTIIQNAPVGILFTDQAGNFTLANPVIDQIIPGGVTGTADGPAGGYTLYHLDGTLYLPDELPLPQALKGISSRDVEMLIRDVNGEESYAAAWANPILAPDGSVEGAVAVMQATTQRKLIESALREARDRMEWMARFPEEITNPVLRVSLDGSLLYANKAASRIPVIQVEVGKVIPPDFAGLIERAVSAQQPVEQDLLFGDRYYAFTAIPIPTEKYLNLYGRDITDRAQMEAERIEFLAQIEVQRRLIRQREMERLQIARNLHDGPFQTLNGANFGLMDAIRLENRPEHRKRLEWVQKAFQQELSEMRAFIQELRPPSLVSYGLETAIRSHLARFSQIYPKMQVNTVLVKDGNLLPEETRLALYRIYQEAMTNAGKHVRATRIDVSLQLEGDCLVLEIKDNGQGFDVPEHWAEMALTDHLGLIGMRERATMIGARLEIQSTSGKGTSIKIQVPVAQPAPNSR